MNILKKAFVELSIDCSVIQFGEFTLKSGRQSPYFFNAGRFHAGRSLRQLGQAYAKAYLDSQLQTPHLFGPAYKGIPLATTTAVALAEAGIQTTVTFNRKEAKTHGERGELIGAPLEGPTTVIDDVITAGTAFREASQSIEKHGGTVHSLIIALDRCERGLSEISAIDDIRSRGVQVISLITLFDIIDYMRHQGEERQADLLQAYQKKYAP